jgi:hypothetical protein
MGEEGQMSFIPGRPKRTIDGTRLPHLFSPHTEHSPIKTEDETEAAVSDSTKTED